MVDIKCHEFVFDGYSFGFCWRKKILAILFQKWRNDIEVSLIFEHFFVYISFAVKLNTTKKGCKSDKQHIRSFEQNRVFGAKL